MAIGQKLRNLIRKWQGVLIVGPAVAAVTVGVNSLGVLQILDWTVLDRFFKIRPLEPPDSRITVVTIDESDIQYIRSWPVNDALLGEIITKLRSHEPAVIGMDLFRDLPVEPGSEKLVEIYQNTPNLIAVEKVVGKKVAPPAEMNKLNQVAMADIIVDPDGKIRRALLSVSENKQTKLSLGTASALMYLEKQQIRLEMVDSKKKYLGLGKGLFKPLEANDGGYVRADVGGYQILLNYRGGRENFQTVSLESVLKNQVPREKIKDKIILIGATGISLNDLFLTPYSTSVAGTPQRMPGVIIHANIASQVLSAALDNRPLFQVWDEQFEWLWVFLWSMLGGIASWKLREVKFLKTKYWLRWLIFIFSGLGFCSSFLVGSYLYFLAGWWVPVIAPMTGFLVSAMLINTYQSQLLQLQTERRLAQFLEAIPVGIAVIDNQGNIYLINERGKELLRYKKQSNVCPQDIAELYQIYQVNTNQIYPNEKLPIVRALRGETSSVDDMEIRFADQVIPLEGWGRPIFDAEGNVIYALVAFQDITERRKTQAELAATIDKLSQVNLNLEEALEAEFKITDAYGRFVPHEFLYFLGYESILEVNLGDNIQMDMAILFADIRDFTSLSETMTPEENFKFINSYLYWMEAPISENNGFIDKYIGDGIMALFSGGADDAVKAGIAMLEALAKYNQTRGTPERPYISIGIGINTGSLMLGTVGGKERMNSTVISDAVNLASRIEGLTKIYGISLLISHHTFNQLTDGDEYSIRLIDRVKVKGKSKMVSIFEVFDADPIELKQLKLETKGIFEEGVILFNTQSYAKAALRFKDCLEINSDDKVAHIYLERCQNYLSQNPNSNLF